MLVSGDLGFRVAVFFIFVLFPAFGFVLRRKWRLAVARQDEINRLLVLASEEAARAELEASFGYTTSISIPSQRFCAVCFTPTANRCARCKSVHYWYVVVLPSFLNFVAVIGNLLLFMLEYFRTDNLVIV